MRNRLIVLGTVLALVLTGIGGAHAVQGAQAAAPELTVEIDTTSEPVELFRNNVIRFTITNRTSSTMTGGRIDYKVPPSLDVWSRDWETCFQVTDPPNNGNCWFKDLAPGASDVVHLWVTTESAGPATVEATVTGKTCDTCIHSTTVSRQFTIAIASEPMRLDLWVYPWGLSYVAGDDIDVTFIVEGDLSQPVFDVALEFGLPAELEPRPDQTVCTRSPCSLGEFDSGRRVELTFKLKAKKAGTFAIKGKLTGRQYTEKPPCYIDPHLKALAEDPNCSTQAFAQSIEDTTEIADTAIGLAVAVTPQPGLLGGDDLTLTYVITNPMAYPVVNARFEFALPAELEVSDADDVCPKSPCETIGYHDTQGGRSVYVLSSQQSVTLTYRLRPSAIGKFTATGKLTGEVWYEPCGGGLAAVADVAVMDECPPDGLKAPVSGEVSGPVEVVRSDALSLAVAVTPQPGYLGGDNMTVTYTARNNKDHQLNGLTLRAQVPAGLTVVSDKDKCLTAEGCQLPALSPGGVHVWTVVFAPSKALGGTATGALTSASPTNEVSASAAVLVLAPVLAITPGVGPPGFVALSRGVKFPPGATVQLRWSQGITVSGNVVTVDATGALTWQALVLPGDVQGKRRLIATWVSGPKFGPVSVEFLVVPPSWEPPLDDVR